MDPDTQMGPQVSEKHLESIENYVEIGKKEGATLVTGGERTTDLGEGHYYKPTVFANVTNDMTIAREEIFGPVISIIPFKDEEDAIRQANDTLYGLAAGVWTNDLKRAHRMIPKLQAGTVYVNTFSMLDSVSPFGGTKGSGFGRELGVDAINMYTQPKSVWMDLNPKHFNWYE